jgi:type II secretory pathway predicted ATPase ExeA
MPRWFNTAGPCRPEQHYMLDPTARLPQVQQLIRQENYFVIHAPRQVGKTTAINRLAQQLTASGQYAAIALSVEVGAPFSDNVGGAEAAILSSWRHDIDDYLPRDLHPPEWKADAPGQQIKSALRAWAKSSPKPLVIFIDEVDSLQDLALLSLLRQLRNGYQNRPHAFPQSIGLVGMRDVRDYKVVTGDSNKLSTASPFNIKVESLTMRNFYAQEVQELYQQHTDDTGQVFTLAAVELVFELTQGQPWLVNAIARQLTEEIAPTPDISITPNMVEEAKEILIRRQDTHLDSLAERLREQRVKVIIEPMLAGQELPKTSNEDRQYLVDLGLLRRDPAGGLVVANPIYREILPRVLAQGPQDSLPTIAPSWLTSAGELDSDRLLQAFLDFWLQHGEALLESAAYPEIAPHLVMMAFLHRVVNGGGTLNREYAIGRDRLDMCLKYGTLTLGIELKVWRSKQADPLGKGLSQLEGYLNRLRQGEGRGSGWPMGWLVIFDRREQAPALEDRLGVESVTTDAGRQVQVIRV